MKTEVVRAARLTAHHDRVVRAVARDAGNISQAIKQLIEIAGRELGLWPTNGDGDHGEGEGEGVHHAAE